MSERKPLGWVVLRTMTDPQSVVIHQRMHSERVYASPELAAQYLGADFTTTGGVRTTYTVEPIGSVPSGEREARRLRSTEEAMDAYAREVARLHAAIVANGHADLYGVASRPGTEGAP